MTKQEAIIVLKNNKIPNGFQWLNEAFDIAIEALQAQQDWIPCSQRLPEEKIDPITNDYCAYLVTVEFDDVKTVRYYKFGEGHWWSYREMIDRYVVAWKPLPEPWRG